MPKFLKYGLFPVMFVLLLMLAFVSYEREEADDEVGDVVQGSGEGKGRDDQGGKSAFFYIIADGLSLRVSRSLDSKMVNGEYIFDKGDRIEVMERNGVWVKCRTVEGFEGWLKAVYEGDVCLSSVYGGSPPNWYMFGLEPSHKGGIDSGILPEGELAWKTPMGDMGLGNRFALVDGRLYVTSEGDAGYDDEGDGLYCVDSRTGNVIWQFSTYQEGRGDSDCHSGVAVVDGRCYFGCDDGYVYCVSAGDGRLIWEFKTGDMVVSSISVIEGRVYAGSWDDRLYCLSAADGGLIWRFGIGDWDLSSPLVVESRVFIGNFAGDIFCLFADDGGFAWRFKAEDWVRSSPCFYDEMVYVGSDDGHIYCLSIEDGSLIWKFETGGEVVSSPCVVADRVYVGSRDDHIYCLSSADGELIWKFKTGDDVLSSPCVVDERVYVGSEDDRLYCLSADGGKPIWEFETGDDLFSSPCVVGGRVYFGSWDGYLYCLK